MPACLRQCVIFRNCLVLARCLQVDIVDFQFLVDRRVLEIAQHTCVGDIRPQRARLERGQIESEVIQVDLGRRIRRRNLGDIAIADRSQFAGGLLTDRLLDGGRASVLFQRHRCRFTRTTVNGVIVDRHFFRSGECSRGIDRILVHNGLLRHCPGNRFLIVDCTVIQAKVDARSRNRRNQHLPCIVVAIRAQVDDIAGTGVRHFGENHVQYVGALYTVLKRQVNLPAHTLGADAGEQFVICRNLLTHDDDLVPFAPRLITGLCSHALGGIDKCIAIAPDEVDFAELGQQVPAARIRFKRPVDQVCSLIVKAVCHVEIGFADRIALIQINRRFSAEGFFQRRRRAGRIILA